MVLGLIKVSVYQGVSAGSTQSTHHTPSLHSEPRPDNPLEQTVLLDQRWGGRGACGMEVGLRV